MRRALAAALVAVLLATTLMACGADADEDCDREDLASQEAECGYYDSAGVWVLYPWVIPGIGGKPPAGHAPKPPAGSKPSAGTKPGGTVKQPPAKPNTVIRK